MTLENKEVFVGFVVDGGTALSSLTSAPTEIFDGYFAAKAAADGIKNGFPLFYTARSLLLEANREIKNRLYKFDIDTNKTDSELLPTCGGASLILINKNKDSVEISQIGDTSVVVVFRNGSIQVAISPSKNFEDIKAYNLAKKISETNHIEIREAMKAEEVTSILTLGRHKENLREGYGALNGKDGAKRFIRSKRYKASNIYRVIAITDGMIPPQKAFSQEPSWKRLAEDVISLGPKKFYEQKIFYVKESDPELKKFPRFKKHDDASLLEIIFQ